MSVKISSGAGYASTILPNADQGAVTQLQSSNSGQTQGAAFSQFANVVSGDQSTLHGLASQINTLESAKPNTLTSAQQAELTSDLQQYETASEKFNSDNAHLIQLAAADDSAPEVQQAITQGGNEAINMQALQSSVSTFVQYNDGISPSTAAALNTVNDSILDQSHAALRNSAVGEPAAGSTNSSSGNERDYKSSPGLVNLSSTSISGQAGLNPFYLPNVQPGAVGDIRSSNAGQSTGTAFNQFASVVNADQSDLNAIAARINTLPVKNPEAIAGAFQQYEKAAEKYAGDQAHLLQIAAADNNAAEVYQATSGGGAEAANMSAIQGLGALYLRSAASIVPGSTAAAISTTLSSIGDQAAAVSHNSITETQEQGIRDQIKATGPNPYVSTSTATGGQ